MNQKRYIFISSLVLIVILGASLVWSRKQPNPLVNLANNGLGDQSNLKSGLNQSDIKSADKISVVASFYPLYEFSKQIGGDLINVTNITPPGVEPHDFEPSSQQIAQIQNAKVFIFNGGGIDPWAEKIALELKNKGLQVLNMTDLLKADLISATSDNQNAGDGSEVSEGFDPHIWLDPVLAQKEIQQIKQVLIQIDSKNEVFYQNNTQIFAKKLIDLDANFKDSLANCNQKTVLASHNAFSYMAKRYDFEVISVSGLSPDQEPSLQNLAKAIELVKAKQIKYITFETLVSPKISETIASETGAATIVLNPIEGLTRAEMDGGIDYISLMQTNLNNLNTVLECK